MFKSPRRKALLLTSMATFVFAVLAFPKLAQALPCTELHHWFYSDATFTDQVGGRIRDCSGGVHTWGQQWTDYWAEGDCCCWNEGCWEGGYGCEEAGEVSCNVPGACPTDLLIC